MSKQLNHFSTQSNSQPKIGKPKLEPILSKQPVENIVKLKVSKSGFISNLTKHINHHVLNLTDNIQIMMKCVCYAIRLSLQFLTLRTLLKGI